MMTPDQTPGRRRRFITIRGERGDEAVDLEMPGDRPLGVLLPDLIKVLNWPASDGDRPLRYQLQTEAGSILSDMETLIEAGVENSDVLTIALVAGAAGDDGAESSAGAMAASSPRSRRGMLAPPRASRFAITEPCLVSARGVIFDLGPPPVTIGRPDRQARPDVDLTELEREGDFVSSRRHAQIVVEAGQHVLLAQPTTNGTFVNGVEIQPGEKRVLRDGDVILFGFQGVEMTFCCSTQTALSVLSVR